jgi:hypothetical protein
MAPQYNYTLMRWSHREADGSVPVANQLPPEHGAVGPYHYYEVGRWPDGADLMDPSQYQVVAIVLGQQEAAHYAMLKTMGY